MAGTRGVLQIGAWPVVSKLVAQSPIEHQNFFPERVLVQIEFRTCVVSHDGSSAGDLTAISLQKPAVNQR
jgi:hypothetical protein